MLGRVNCARSLVSQGTRCFAMGVQKGKTGATTGPMPPPVYFRNAIEKFERLKPKIDEETKVTLYKLLDRGLDLDTESQPPAPLKGGDKAGEVQRNIMGIDEAQQKFSKLIDKIEMKNQV